MIIRANKGFETNTKYPNSDWYNDGNTLYVVDETTPEGKELAGKIQNAYPFYDYVTNDKGELIDIAVYPPIQYSIDKNTITTVETATISIIEPAVVVAVIDDEEYTVTDGEIEYSNENPGQYTIILKADGYKWEYIAIEVVEA